MSRSVESCTLIKATFWRRLTAMLLDGLLFEVVAWMLSTFFPAAATILQSYIIFFAYQVLMERFFGGSLGKLILHLRVVIRNGHAPGLSEAFFRNTGRIVSAMPLMMGYFRILAPHRWRTMHDEIGNCWVVKISRTTTSDSQSTKK